MRVQLSHSRAVVTGAGSGIGRAAALALTGAGAEVACLDIDGPAVTETGLSCERLARGASHYVCDVTDYDAFSEVADRIERERGPVDVVVNNAGVGLAGPFTDHTIEDWRWLRSVNIDGVVNGCQLFAGRMSERGRGQLVNIASMAGFMPHSRMAAYCTSKAAVIMFSQCLRQDLRRSGVGVSAICPGVIDTPIPRHTRFVGEMASKRDRAITAFSHGHNPEEVAKAIVSAIERDREIVPVGIESQVAYRALRHSPGAVRGLLARLPLG